MNLHKCTGRNSLPDQPVFLFRAVKTPPKKETVFYFINK
ncbi:hypothetical protein CHISP_0551 [Chitinispirillum alkaliphilum]|nr:hypothetical protein CHISP_0551 [Chitinispirillum alkaliphilum]